MNWSAVSAWLDENTVPDLSKISRHQIEVLYIDPRASNVAAVKKMCTSTLVGAYVAASWYGSDPVAAANLASKQVQAYFPKVGAEAPPAMLDLEDRTLAWKATFIRQYRRHQPARPTAYTDAPFKSGEAPISVLGQESMPVFVQLYQGDMSPVDASAAILDVCRAGMPALMVHPFYDGAVPVNYGARDGCFFTLGRLP